MGYNLWGPKESDTTECLTLSLFIPKLPQCVIGQGLRLNTLIRDLVAERFLKSSPVASRVDDPLPHLELKEEEPMNKLCPRWHITTYLRNWNKLFYEAVRCRDRRCGLRN